MEIHKYEGKNLVELKEKALTELNASEEELYIRESEDKENALLIAVNRWCDDAVLDLPKEFKNSTALLGNPPTEDGKLIINSEDIVILKR